jgi:hypothetical protein
VTAFTASVVEEAALAWLESIAWRIAHGPDIAPDMPAAERRDYGEVALAQRLRDALARLNPDLPGEALEDAFRRLTRPEGADFVQRNRFVYRLLVDGVTVEYRTAEGDIRGAQARVIDFDAPANNDWLAVNQFSITENKHARRPDVVLFVRSSAKSSARARARIRSLATGGSASPGRPAAAHRLVFGQPRRRDANGRTDRRGSRGTIARSSASCGVSRTCRRLDDGRVTR